MKAFKRPDVTILIYGTSTLKPIGGSTAENDNLLKLVNPIPSYDPPLPQLHTETVTPFLLQTLRSLMQKPALSSFQLAGGTSIALLTGHRQSIDLDLFTNQPINYHEVEVIIRPMNPGTIKQNQIGVLNELPDLNVKEALKVDFCNW